MDTGKLLLLILTIFHGNLFAQEKVEIFTLETPRYYQPGSLYRSIKVVDLRNDTSDYGKVQKGGQNKIVRVALNESLESQLTRSLELISQGNYAGNDELLFMVRQLKFSEVLGTGRTGFIDMDLVIFEGKGGRYKKIRTVDIKLVVTAELDVTRKLFKEASSYLNLLLATASISPGRSDIELTINDVHNIDSLEKQKLPLYTNAGFIDGMYFNYNSFKMQIPDRTNFRVKLDKKEEIQKVYYTGKDGKETAIYNDGTIYAIVYEGKPYIASISKFYGLERKGNDFYFTGKVQDVLPENVDTANDLFGIVGFLLATGETSVYELKVNHLNGSFKKIRKIEKY